MDIGRITILGDSPSPAAGGRCQTVSYMISGNTEQHRTHSSSALLYLYLRLCLHRDSGQQRALGLRLRLQSQRNLMLSVIVGLLLRVCREEGNVSAEVSHRAAQARGVPHGGQLIPPVLSHMLRSGHAQRGNSLRLLFSMFVAFVDKTTTWENLIMECFIPMERHVKI